MVALNKISRWDFSVLDIVAWSLFMSSGMIEVIYAEMREFYRCSGLKSGG